MECIPFGRTGHVSSRAIFGGASLGKVTQPEADNAIELALQFGVNHVDTAPSYGESELRIGSWISRHGKMFFLATKTGERTAAKARDEILRSLERLRVGAVDLLQLHNLTEQQEWETAMGPGGALEAALEARAQGLVRFIGVTGHGLGAARMHIRSLQRFEFDSVLLPFSYMLSRNLQYRAEFDTLSLICHQRSIAMQTIKSIVRAPWGERRHTRATWYEPIEDQAEIDLSVHWVLGNNRLFINTVGDVNVLPKVLASAEGFSVGPSDEDMQTQVKRLGIEPLFS